MYGLQKGPFPYLLNVIVKHIRSKHCDDTMQRAQWQSEKKIVITIIICCLRITFAFVYYCRKNLKSQIVLFLRLIVLGFNDTSTLVGHFVLSPREREKRDRRDSR